MSQQEARLNKPKMSSSESKRVKKGEKIHYNRKSDFLFQIKKTKISFRVFLRFTLYNICRKDVDYLRLYNNCIKENFGYNFNDGTRLAKIFQDISDITGERQGERVGRQILDIIRKVENN